MANGAKTYVIILDSATAAEREAVHRAIKETNHGWWHRFEDVWLVTGGKTPSFWRDLVHPLIPSGRSSVLVLSIEHGKYSYYGIEPDERLAWLKEHF